MKGLIQRVTSAEVTVAGDKVGAIARGVLLFLGVDKGDDRTIGCKLVEKAINYRIFPDDQGRMNRSLLDIGGGLLVVSQFTLAADTGKGLRPSFSSAADPAHAELLYLEVVEYARQRLDHVATGRFAADMQVSLCNDGPVTFLLESA